MRKLLAGLLVRMLVVGGAEATKPPIGEEAWIKPAPTTTDGVTEESSYTGYTDAEINEITNVVNGEVGGIGSASVVLT